jgi:ribonuclease P protein component
LNISAIRHTFKVYERLKREQHIHTLFLSGKAFSVFPIRIIYRLSPINDGVPGGAESTDVTVTGSQPVAEAVQQQTAAIPHFCPLQAGFSVPKKRFRKSVHRHRVRRLLVEAWRHGKHQVIAAVPPGMQLHVFLIFTGNELPEYAQVLQAVNTGIDRLVKNLTPRPETKDPDIALPAA